MPGNRLIIQGDRRYGGFRIRAVSLVRSRSGDRIVRARALDCEQVALVKRLGLKTVSGEPIAIPPKNLGLGIRYPVGSTFFGLGWALTGACPGPLFALVGNGVTVMIVAIGRPGWNLAIRIAEAKTPALIRPRPALAFAAMHIPLRRWPPASRRFRNRDCEYRRAAPPVRLQTWPAPGKSPART